MDSLIASADATMSARMESAPKSGEVKVAHPSLRDSQVNGAGEHYETQ